MCVCVCVCVCMHVRACVRVVVKVRVCVAYKRVPVCMRTHIGQQAPFPFTAVSSKMTVQYSVLHTALYVFRVIVHVAVAVLTRLFVIEAECMHHLMQDFPFEFTATLSYYYVLLASHLTDIC